MSTRTIRINVDPRRLQRAARAEEFASQVFGRDPVRRFELEVAAILESEDSFQGKVESSNRQAHALRAVRASVVEESIEAAMLAGDEPAPASPCGMTPL